MTPPALPRLLLLSLTLLVAPAGAADFVVTRYDDPVPDGCLASDCSLREAIDAANLNAADADRVLLSAGRYVLSLAGVNEDLNATGDLDIGSDMEIIGAGARLTVIDAGRIDRVFHVSGAFIDSVRFRGLGIQRGRGDGAHPGSGIMVGATAVVVEDCELRENGQFVGSDGIGDALFVSIGGHVSVIRSTITANFASAIRASQGQWEAENSTMSSNFRSELLLLNGATGSCRHCTIFDGGPVDAINVSVQGTGTVLELVNSIVVGTCNVATGGTIVSLGGNLESPGDSCGLLAANDQVNIESPRLTALDDQGGPTFTHDPLTASPATDAALAAACLADDQRGAGRTDAACDVGAVERTAERPLTPLFIDGFLQGDAEAWSAVVP